jgi:hypothetical protein
MGRRSCGGERGALNRKGEFQIGKKAGGENFGKSKFSGRVVQGMQALRKRLSAKDNQVG